MASKSKKKQAKPSPPPADSADAAAVPSDPRADGEDAQLGDLDVLDILSIPRELSGDASVSALRAAHELFAAGNYAAAREQLVRVRAQKNVPKPILDGTETFLSAMAIDTPSLIVACLLAVFLVFILFEVY
jgi:hypothetical protein